MLMTAALQQSTASGPHAGHSAIAAMGTSCTPYLDSAFNTGAMEFESALTASHPA
jgi:hypothetical protein